LTNVKTQPKLEKNFKLQMKTINQLIKSFKEKNLKPSDFLEECINKIESQKHLNAFISTNFVLARKQALGADKKYQNNEEVGQLEGIPVAVKDLFCTKGIKTTSASKMLENFTPTYESTVTQKLLDEGAIMIGKTNMDEFAMGSTNSNSYFGNCINPYKAKNSDDELVSGGSSGGSAIAVSAGMCPVAIGSDTGGSVRQPASFNNIFGIKPTYGRCSRYGMIAYASSLDQAGIFTKNSEDAAIVMQVISGYDDKDSTSINQEVPNFKKLVNSDIRGKKIGIPKEYNNDNLPQKIKEIWQKTANQLKEKGAEIIEISLVHTKYASAVYYITSSAECSSNLSRYDGVRYGHRAASVKNLEELYKKTRSEGFGTEVKRRIMTGAYVLSAGYYDAYFKKAGKVRRLILEDFKKAFTEVDIILTPTTPSSAFSIKEGENLDPIQMYLNDIFTIPASLAGMPCASIPCGFDEKELPVGMQLIANQFNEQEIFNIAKFLENN
jgi:aspartyl-tRNA(Asn)/glutamyl-tRNA(Gln) amidotransferase subunit A